MKAILLVDHGSIRREANEMLIDVANLVQRMAGNDVIVKYAHMELRLGAKAFHFKTSTQAEFFSHGTISSAFVGVRWYSQ